MAVTEIKTHEKFTEVINGDKAVAIDFHAVWCGPCRIISPVFEKFSRDGEYKDIDFYKLDVDEVTKSAEQAGVTAMPTFQIYKNGKKVKELVGANSNGLKQLLDSAKEA